MELETRRTTNPNEIPKLILTRTEVCKYLRVSVRLLDEWRMRADDPLPCFQSSKKLLFSLPLVNEWFNRQVEKGRGKV